MSTNNNLPTEAKERKATPLFAGFIKYFPKAMAEVARLSLAATVQHHQSEGMHWDRSKSGDELEALTRHLVDVGTFDSDGQRHSAKVAWRAMANLEKELEAAIETTVDLTSEPSKPRFEPQVNQRRPVPSPADWNAAYLSTRKDSPAPEQGDRYETTTA